MWRIRALWLIYAIWEVTPQERLGCYQDKTPFILSGIIYRDRNNMTVDWCLNECLIRRGDVFAGLEAGYACLCGNNMNHTKYGPQRPDSECRQSSCAGNGSQKCGGPDRLDIYRDYNECSQHNGGCGMAYINTPLSYYCDDRNECDDEKGGCNQKCVNSPGAYHCACHMGYGLVGGEKQNCTDVNECIDDPDLCSMDNFECINTPGSYRCECKPGYMQNNGSCSDIDECSLGDDKCNQNCNNTDGDYICSCMTGYEFTGGQLYNCTDEDECAGVNTCDQLCTNLPGGYECSCYDGYRSDDEQGASCTDVDECTEGSHQCDQTCINTPGLYQCTCELGYHMEQDLFTCFECENGKYGMECNETCQCGDTNFCNASTGACFKALQQTEDGNDVVALSVGILVPAILVTLGVSSVIAIFRRRKYEAQKTAKDNLDNVVAATVANHSGAYENVVVDVDNVVILENPHSMEAICDSSRANQRQIEQHTLSNNTGPENSQGIPATTPHKQHQTSTDTSDAYTNFIPVAELDSYADDTSGIEMEYKSVLPCYGIGTESMGDD